MNSAWRKLLPDCVEGRDFEGFNTEDFAVVDDIVSLGKNMSLEINNESQAESSGAKRQKREKEEPPGRQLHDVLMEGDSPSKQ
jgi:hypothetical protein